MKKQLIALFEEGHSFTWLRDTLDGKSIDGKAVKMTVDSRALPYLDHLIAGWIDGPPSSNVVAVMSGADPKAEKWRRFALSRKGPWSYEIDVFPTPFTNASAPLSPGIPPSGRAGH